MIVVIDDEDRENEGDLTMAAEKITPEAINFMAKLRTRPDLPRHDRRAPRLPASCAHVGREHLATSAPPSPNPSTPARASPPASPPTTARTPSRSPSIPATRPNDLARPGHIFPLRARKGGVLVRAGQTEASVDLARLAGLIPAGVICEIMNDDGTMARVPELAEFCRQHNLKMLTVAELIRYRMANERYVRRVTEALVPTAYGEFRMIVYESEINGDSHIALVKGDVEGMASTPATSRCWCACTPIALSEMSSAPPGANAASAIDGAMRRIAEEGRGALIYLHQTSQATPSRSSATS